jgi:hypothetical protein
MMSDPILYPTWHRLPRACHFPKQPTLERLLDCNFNPALDGFKLCLRRREARDLRKGLFGPKGLRDVPKGEGQRTFDLPNCWTLRLTYSERPEGWRKAGDVEAEFIPPPRAHQRPGRTQKERSLAA